MLAHAKCALVEALDVGHASTSSVHTTSATLMRRLFRFKGYIPTRAKIYFAFRNCTIIYCAGDAGYFKCFNAFSKYFLFSTISFILSYGLVSYSIAIIPLKFCRFNSVAMVRVLHEPFLRLSRTIF